VHNETLSVIAMRVGNEDRATARILGCDTAPTPTGFAEIVGDDFPLLHAILSENWLDIGRAPWVKQSS
jgi:hypothetical protein